MIYLTQQDNFMVKVASYNYRGTLDILNSMISNGTIWFILAGIIIIIIAIIFAVKKRKKTKK